MRVTVYVWYTNIPQLIPVVYGLSTLGCTPKLPQPTISSLLSWKLVGWLDDSPGQPCEPELSHHHVMCWIAADHIKFRPTTSTRSGKPQLTHPSRRAYLWLRHVEGTFPMKLKPNEFILDMYDMMACWVRIILATIKWSPLLVQEYHLLFRELITIWPLQMWCLMLPKWER